MSKITRNVLRRCFAGGLLLASTLVAAPAALAQLPAFTHLNPQGAKVQVLPIRGNIYMLVGAGGNITASIGPDGVLLVDAGMENMSDEVLAAIRRIQSYLQASGELTVRPYDRGASDARSHMPWHPATNLNSGPPKPIRFIINTHVHPDHSGGNLKLAATGITYTGGNVAGTIADAAQGAEVIAHEEVMRALARTEAPFGALPTMTYFTPEMKMSIFFNGDGIRLMHMPDAHTSGDTVVHFRGSDVIATGDLFSMNTYPVIDLDRGGSLDGIIRSLNFILEVAIPEFRTEGGTMIIPGHGRLADSADLGYYRDMLTIIRDRIRRMIEEGKSEDEVVAAKPTFGYDGRFGATSGFWTTEQFVRAAYKSLQRSEALSSQRTQ